MKKAFVKALCEEMTKNNNIYVLTGDLGYGIMNPIMDKFPERFINVGICEQNMASMAAGLALEGNMVFIYSIGNFPTLRCLEQIRNDIAYHDANVKIVAVGGGFAYGDLGMSHHATEDIAIMRAVPGIQVISPGDLFEAQKAVEYAVSYHGPVYLRLGKGGEKDIIHASEEVNRIIPFYKSNSGGTLKVAVLGTGPVICEVDKLRDDVIAGVELSLYSVPFIKPFDTDGLVKVCENNDVIITMEEHNVIGGLGSVVAEAMIEKGCMKRLIKLGLKEQFTSVVGSPSYIRRYYRIDCKAILQAIDKIQKEKSNE